MKTALADIRVLDLSRILAGPWCTQNLADLGAEVIKVERPGVGDDTRSWGPPWLKDAEGGALPDSTYYSSANRGKKSITVDMSSAAGQDIVRQLAAVSDVVVENYKVGDLKRYGLDYESLRAINPRLVFCSITGFGQEGPYAHRPGYDYVFQGMGGLMSITGERDDLPGGGPQKVGVAVVDMFTGMYATVAILAALRHRDATGEGQYIDMALLDCGVTMGANQIAGFLTTGNLPKRFGNAHANAVPYGVFDTADGQIILAVANDGQWKKFCTALGEPVMGQDERFVTTPGRITHRDACIAWVREQLARRQRAGLLQVLEDHGVPCGPINNYAQVFDDPQVQFRGMRTDIPHPQGHVVPTVSSPLRLSASPVIANRAPPRLGEHTREVLGQLLHLDAAALDALVAGKVV